MKISELQPEFKNYLLIEKGVTVKTFKGIVSTLAMLTQHAKTDELRAFHANTIREFMYAQVQEKLWQPKTFRNHWQNLKTFFDWGIKKGFLKNNPVEGIEKPKMKKRLPRSLSKEDTLKILYYSGGMKWTYKLEKSRIETIIHTFLFSGLRLQELLNLQVRDVNLEDESIFVRQGKGSKDRLVPIHPQLLPKLRGYFLERQKLLKPSQWFFTSVKSDKKLGCKDIQRICNKISSASSVKFTPHMLRHTFGKLAVEADFSIYKLKEIMGHAQVTTTQIYVSIASESIKKSFNAIQLL